MNLKVNEIFFSIQGESVHAGLPCVFVRLTGCNLRCRYCDTQYAFHEGSDMSVAQIIEQVGSFGGNLVEITGGEPLVQDHTPTLVDALLESDEGCVDGPVDHVGPLRVVLAICRTEGLLGDG